MTLRFVLSCVALVCCAACQSQPPLTNVRARADAVQQWSGQHGGGETPGVRALRTREEWSAFWRQVERDAPPAPDFNRYMGVAISLGARPTAGFGATVDGTREEGGKLIVDYRTTSPTPGTLTAQVLTAPWTVAIVPRSDLPLVSRDLASRTRQGK